MSRRRLSIAALGVALLVVALVAARRGAPPSACADAGRAPRLAPDYTDLTLPPNIAPLNFRVAEPGRRYFARLSASSGPGVALHGRGSVMAIPAAGWRLLLRANVGRELAVQVYVQDADGRWSRFQPVRWRIAQEPIDSHLVYRWFLPAYSSNTPLGLYQRDLTTFRQTPIIRSPSSGRRCVNCHAFGGNDPQRFVFQVRGTGKQTAMMAVREGRATTSNPLSRPDQRPTAISSWHPSGRWIVCSRNWIRQYFHEHGSPGRDALDARASLSLVDVAGGASTDPPQLNLPGYMPAFPCWSPDGRWLYYSRVARFWPAESAMPVAEQERVRYDLVRTAFDAERAAFGPTEVVLAAKDAQASVLQPRISPDGRWLVVCLAGHGGFPIFCPRADLAMVDLSRSPGRARLLEPSAVSLRETWHSWSSNGRWLVSARKSDNNVLGRIYLRHIAADGTVGRAFVLPQADPTAYDRMLQTYNIPELVTGPVTIGEAALLKAAGPLAASRTEDQSQSP